MMRPNDRKTAADFLTHCFAPGETIALLLRRTSPADTLQRVVSLQCALAPRYLGWLAHQNALGFNVYVGANPLRFDSRKRTKENVAHIRHLYLDIDADGDARLAALHASKNTPTVNCVVTTSPSKYQILWRVIGFDLERQESALKHLVLTFGGDSACTDCNRVLRVPGFRSWKYDPAPVVTVEYFSDSVSNPDDFRLEIHVSEAMAFARANAPARPTSKHSHSEHDWNWILRELCSGKDPIGLTQLLAARRTDKPNPLYYAQRTVDMASARLWLLEGASTDDVISLLIVRHNLELPDTLCVARAREIAMTAQRRVVTKTKP